MRKFYNNVLLGPTEGLPPCLERAFWPGTMAELEDNLSAEVACLFFPSRRGHLWLRLLNNGTVSDESWVCPHQECWEWAEQQADRLCPFEELPDSFYGYLRDESRDVEEMLRRHEPVTRGAHPLYENALSSGAKDPPLVPLERIMGVLQMLGEPVGQRT